jgi:hypothetical protein
MSNGSYVVSRGNPTEGTLGMVHPVGFWTRETQWWVAVYPEHERIGDEEASVIPFPLLLDRYTAPPVAGWGQSVEAAAAHLTRPR